MHMTGRCGSRNVLIPLSLFFMVALCIVPGCVREKIPVSETVPTTAAQFSDSQRAAAIAVALNDREVQGYLRNNYTIKNVGPLCYEQSLPDRNIYKSCFIGVEIETQEDYLIAYVDLEKSVVNKTMTMYIRNPVIAPSESVTAVP
jgi:hypothetical protein